MPIFSILQTGIEISYIPRDLLTFRYPEKPINRGFVYGSVAYVLYAVDCPHIPITLTKNGLLL